MTSGRDWHDLAAGGQNLAALRKPGHDFEMPTCCEICEHFLSREKQPQSARDVSEVVFGKRTVRLCRVHRDHGEAMLPESCYHFPRRALMDARG